MDGIGKSALIARMETVARHAGSLMAARPVERVSEKGAFDFVTEVDMAINAYLADALPALVPGSIVVSEETAGQDYRFERPTWIIDPVDGTTNLIFGANESAVSIGLVAGGAPQAGVVYNPFADEMYSAQSGGGAFLNGQPIRPRPDLFLRDSLIGFGTSPYDKSMLIADLPLFSAIFSQCIDLRRGGSAALDLCHVACGRLTGFFERELRPWDFAAGLVILMEAGATVTTFSGRTPSLACPDSILASNGAIHGELLSLIEPFVGLVKSGA